MQNLTKGWPAVGIKGKQAKTKDMYDEKENKTEKDQKAKAAIFQQQEWTKVNKSSLAVSQSRLLDHHMKLENEQKYDNKYIQT